jgi:hypothetical protein
VSADAFDLEAQVEELRSTVGRLSNDLRRSKVKTDQLIAAVYQAAHDAAQGLVLPHTVTPPADRRRGTPEVAIAVLSDWQLAKWTATYNSAVCEERIALYAAKVKKLVEIQRKDHPVRELRVYLLGDLIEGELIFPGQQHLIDASLFRQVMVDGPRILSTFLLAMSEVFESIRVVGVIGNHGALGGRARRDYHPESNGDTMMYEATRLFLDGKPQAKRIEWAPNFREHERHWYATDMVGEKRFMLFHGDQVKGYNGIPWYGFDRKVKGWAMILDRFKQERIDYAVSGHFHTPFREYINGIRHWGNGTTESSNTYALEQLAASGEPSQWLLFCHPERGVTAEYEVDLKEPGYEERAI